MLTPAMLDRIRRFFHQWVRGESPTHTRAPELAASAHLQEMLRSIVDTVVDAIITIDEKGTVGTFNRAAERIFGYAKEEVIGRNVSVLIPPPDRDRHDQYIDNYLRTGHAKVIGIGREVMARRKDGSVFPAELGISEFHLGTARFFTGIVRDISERRKLEQELYRRMRQLADADQRKDQFIGLLSHELRNPLAPVRNGLQILRRSDAQHEVVHRVVNMMDRQVAHMTRLIDDLLDVSRLTSGKIELRRESVALGPILQQATETVSADIAGKGQELVVENEDEDIVLCVDPVRIAQVISNLLHNAMKFSEPGDRIIVRVRREADMALIEVKDTGVGIAPDKL
ncbi:MAG TPA: PAS domain-containing sensor histidine kinase, partial [Burkholderiales bacterium]|nr:PAS domain-containing sensor histidine kinase [Burkholderiales bacterium]